MRTLSAIAGFEDGTGLWTKKCQQTLEVGRGKKTDSPPGSSEEILLCQHLDFSLMKLVLDILPPKLQGNKLHCFNTLCV